jgi:hypothetical protein
MVISMVRDWRQGKTELFKGYGVSLWEDKISLGTG